jgi:hypothetical protein
MWQFETASLVAKLAGARLRKRQANGRCAGEGNRADVRSWELPTAAVVVMVRRFWRSADASC